MPSTRVGGAEGGGARPESSGRRLSRSGEATSFRTCTRADNASLPSGWMHDSVLARRGVRQAGFSPSPVYVGVVGDAAHGSLPRFHWWVGSEGGRRRNKSCNRSRQKDGRLQLLMQLVTGALCWVAGEGVRRSTRQAANDNDNDMAQDEPHFLPMLRYSLRLVVVMPVRRRNADPTMHECQTSSSNVQASQA